MTYLTPFTHGQDQPAPNSDPKDKKSPRVGKVTQRSLTKQLRELEGDGIIHREVFAVVPPRVEYSLTEKGRALRNVVAALQAWGSAHKKQPQA